MLVEISLWRIDIRAKVDHKKATRERNNYSHPKEWRIGSIVRIRNMFN